MIVTPYFGIGVGNVKKVGKNGWTNGSHLSGAIFGA